VEALQKLRRTAKRLQRANAASAATSQDDEPEFDLYGGVAAAYYSTEPEVLLAGPAGTGKTLGWLLKIKHLCEDNPGARVLIVRKTRESLTESVLVTWERDVLGPMHPVLTTRPVLRRVRQSYDFPNGSTVGLGGMDKPDKVLSSERDFIYCPEGTELTIGDWETLNGRLRGGPVVHKQLVADCNPGPPSHWMYRRHLSGGLRLIGTTHRDNPRYWDRDKQEWTKEGTEYLARLGRLTGARKKRFLEGIWAAAEGLVYDYEPTLHLLPADWVPPKEWPRYWSLDWGYNDPLVLQFWAVDGKKRPYLYRERFVSQTRVEDIARWAGAEVGQGREPRPKDIVADHDPECVATFRKYSELFLNPADKTDRDAGIQELQGRFLKGDDGRPGIFFHPNARREPEDKALVEAGRPTSTVDELSGYVWDTRDPNRPKDLPISYNDHGMDAMRYMSRRLSNPGPAAHRLIR